MRKFHHPYSIPLNSAEDGRKMWQQCDLLKNLNILETVMANHYYVYVWNNLLSYVMFLLSFAVITEKGMLVFLYAQPSINGWPRVAEILEPFLTFPTLTTF